MTVYGTQTRAADSSEARADERGGKLSLSASIVIYRTPVERLRPLIEQLFAQNVARLYLVDNSPLDFDTFAGWQPRGDVITIRTGSNLGYGRAHNIAIREAVKFFRYHLVCNPDITLGDNSLATIAAVLDQRPRVGLCMPKVVGTDGEIQYLCKRPPAPVDFFVRGSLPTAWFDRRRIWFETRDLSYEEERSVECLSGCFMFFRSSVLSTVGGFDERFFLYLEDFDISRRASQHAENLYYPGACVVHVHQRGHRKRLRLFLAVLASAIRYFNKWGWFEQTWSLKPALASARGPGDNESRNVQRSPECK